MPDASVRTSFLGALARLHERFLVGVEGVTEVWLVRHGDAYGELAGPGDSAVAPHAENTFFGDGGEGQVPARIDPPLSPTGRRQAAQLGVRLAHSGVGVVWSSALLRAQETASLAAAPGGLRTEVDDRLREVRTRWDDFDKQPQDEDPDAPGTAYIPFVEPLDEVVARMSAAVRDIAADAGPGGRAVAVSHAGAISMYLADLLGLDSGPLRILPQFTSVSVVLLKDDRAVVQSIADVGHLVRERADG